MITESSVAFEDSNELKLGKNDENNYAWKIALKDLKNVNELHEYHQQEYNINKVWTYWSIKTTFWSGTQQNGNFSWQKSDFTQKKKY